MVERPTSTPARLMGEADAAAYLGISPTTLRRQGFNRRKLGALRLYERADLDQFADSLEFESPKEGGAREESETCDDAKKAFG
ncbi:MAG: helix-turn-helix domain-containing protein [Pseudomonadota bacterium]